MLKTIYMMRLWKDGTVSVIWSGKTVGGALNITREAARKSSDGYDGRHWLAAAPVVKPATVRVEE